MRVRNITIDVSFSGCSNINTENDAFRESGAAEVERILTGLAEEIHDNNAVRSHAILDINGNTVGHIHVRRI